MSDELFAAHRLDGRVVVRAELAGLGATVMDFTRPCRAHYGEHVPVDPIREKVTA